MKIFELFSNSPKTWTQNNFAQDSAGRGVASTDDKAISWCLMGAIIKCYPEITHFQERKETIVRILEKLKLSREMSNLIYWNDSPNTTFEMVYNVVKELDI